MNVNMAVKHSGIGKQRVMDKLNYIYDNFLLLNLYIWFRSLRNDLHWLKVGIHIVILFIKSVINTSKYMKSYNLV